MSNALLLSPYYSDLATITYAAGGSDASFPITNLQTQNPNKVARTTQTTSQRFTLSFPTAIAATAVALVGATHSGAATWKIGASNSSAAASYTSPSFVAVAAGTTMWPSGRPSAPGFAQPTAFASWVNTNAFLYWSLEFTDSTPLFGYFQAGRLMLGAAVQPTANLDQSVALRYFSADAKARTAWNQSLNESRGALGRHFDLTWSYYDQDEARLGVTALVRQRGAAGDFFFSLDPTDPDGFSEYSMQATFAPLPALAGAPVFNGSKQCWQVTCGLDEEL